MHSHPQPFRKDSAMATADRQPSLFDTEAEVPEALEAQVDDLEATESGARTLLEEETGLDLADVSPFDTDHVVVDEESTRIAQAPD